MLLQIKLDGILLVYPSCQFVAPAAVDREDKSPAFMVHPVPKEGTSAVVIDVGAGCGGRGSVVARFMRADERR
jgi:hypothetical protein